MAQWVKNLTASGSVRCGSMGSISTLQYPSHPLSFSGAPLPPTAAGECTEPRGRGDGPPGGDLIRMDLGGKSDRLGRKWFLLSNYFKILKLNRKKEGICKVYWTMLLRAKVFR